MGIGAITLDTAGAVTAPTDALKLSLGSALSPVGAGGLPVVTEDIPPDDPGVLYSDGKSYVRHIWDGTIYRTGGLAPDTVLTATPTGTQATALLDLDVVGNGASIYNPGTDVNDVFVLGPSYVFSSLTIYPTFTFGTTLTAQASSIRVLKGATGDLTLDNIQDVVNGVNEGVTWIAPYGAGDMVGVLQANVEVATHATSYQADFRAKDFGTSGNGFRAYLSNGTWTDCDLEASGTSGTAIGTVNYFAGGADGSGTQPAKGTYRYIYQWFRKVDGAITGSSPETDAVTQGTAQNVDLTVLTASADSTFDFTRWSRTLKDQRRYYRGDEIARAGTTDTDDKSDTTLTTFPTIYEQRKFRTYGAGHIPRHRWLVSHQHRIFMGGHRPSATYSAGTATFANGSKTVTIANAYPRSIHEGRTIRGGTDSESYKIVAVSESAQTYTLNRNYEGALGSGASYEVTDDVDANTILFTEVRKPNQANSLNTVGGIISRAGEGSLAAVSIWEVLIVFTRDGAYRLIGTNPNNYALRPASGAMGIISSRSVVKVDDVLYWQAPDGIYRWQRGLEPENIARPKVQQGIVRGINETVKRVNAAHSTWAHAHYAPDEKVVRFFCPLDDDVVPNHAIVYDLQTGALTVDRVPGVTSSATVTKPNGDRVTVFGTLTGEIFHADISNSDGAFGFEPKTTATSGTTKVWTDTGAAFPTSGDGLSGVPFVYVDAAGAFAQTVIQSNTATALTFTHHLPSAPVAGWQGYVGGIWGHIKSGRAHFGFPDDPKTVSNLRVAYAPDVDGKLIVAVAADQDTLAVPPFGSEQIDLSLSDGIGHILMNTTGRAHQFEAHALEPGCDPQIISIGLDLHARRKAQVIR